MTLARRITTWLAIGVAFGVIAASVRASSIPPIRPEQVPRASASPGAAHAGKKKQAQQTNATAECRDGTYSHATERSQACRQHGGVANWLSEAPN